jgi:glycosyltransferase involved in cell wall biosynthesis
MATKFEIVFVSMSHRDGEETYVSLLEKAGITVHSGRLSLWKLLRTTKFKAAFLEFFITAEYYLDRIRLLQPECIVIVDSVDVHYLRCNSKYDLTKDEYDLAVYRETKERELTVYGKADAVITVTDDDASVLLADCPGIRCEIVPNVHDICINNASPEENLLIFVGGFKHVPNVDAVLYFCKDIFPLIIKEKPDSKLVIVGSNPPDQVLGLENEVVKVTGYVPEITSYLHSSLISVAPLRFGAGMKGKIGEAMAHGVPLVTTSVGAQGMGLIDRENVMIADSAEGFAAAVLELMSDSNLRENIRINAVKIVNDKYTPEQVGQTLNDALERIFNNSAKRMKLREKASFLKNYVAECIKKRFVSVC